MSITRHNYEEYFILYMDNELAPAERRMVEEFVQLHPDLKEELDLLLQYKLTPDLDIVFSGKEELRKGQQESFITLSDYEEYLLLYTDNELNAAEKTAVEQFAAENLVVKKELDLLGLTRLQPEAIEFPDKASLYRKEEKVKAMPVRWWRAAAAVLILGLGLAAIWMINSKPDNDAVAGTPAGKSEIKSPAPVLPKENSEAVAVTGDNNQPENKNATPDALQVPGSNKNTPIARATVNNPVSLKSNLQQPDKNDAVTSRQPDKKSNHLPEPVNNPNVSDPQNSLAVNAVPEKNNAKGILTNTDVTNNYSSSPDIKPGIDFAVARPAEQETFVENDGRKSKLRGFFRKVTRTFEKRTNIDPTDQDNRLLVGGLAINLK